MIPTLEVAGSNYALPEMAGSSSGGGFAFGLYKAGSTLLYKVIQKITNRSNVGFVNVVRHFRQLGLVLERSELAAPSAGVLRDCMDCKGIVFGGWREFPQNYELPLRADTRTYLLVRDPRDMLTSLYFSLKFSHTTEGPDASGILSAREKLQSTDIDTFVLSQAPRVAQYFSDYRQLDTTQLMLRRYEDVIFDKPAFVSDVCEHFGIDAPEKKRLNVAASVDERPDEEDVHAHVRRVTPGDHLSKLRAETIDMLNTVFRDVINRYNYDA